MDDRSWMYRHKLADGTLNEEFCEGVDKFISYALSQRDYVINTMIRCPCLHCENATFAEANDVKVHLFKNGFIPNYTQWTHQGELSRYTTRCQTGFQPPVMPGHELNLPNPMWGMPGTVMNEHMSGMPSSVINNQSEPVNDLRQMMYDMAGSGHGQSSGVLEEEPNEEAKAFYELINALDEELYPGCEKVSLMSMMARMMSFKSENSVSDRSYDTLLELFHDVLPAGHKLLANLYETKKFLKGLGLPVRKIDCCPNGCMLFWKEDKDRDKCRVCNNARYKEDVSVRSRSRTTRAQGNASSSASRESTGGRKRVALKKMYYFPIGPRLKRLYYSRATASEMTWHHEHVCADDTMCHPCDSEAWHDFNSKHEQFASEPRNVRLGLCTDGFQPFGQSGQQYSSWPIILTPYNLPPWLCLKGPVMFLTILVPGPSNPKHKIDVYLQPLIDELTELWVNGISAWDVSQKQNFTLRAALIWTVSDFPAYAMLSGWGTGGYQACPYCTEYTQAFYLKHGHKICWFDSHRKFLPCGHPYRRNKTKFRKNCVENSYPPPIYSGEDLLAQIENLGLLKVTEKDAEAINRRIVSETDCGWRRKSIFWDLPYWKTNLVRHNLDVMHIEKNVFDNLFNTLMSVEGKTKDTSSARDDCAALCKRPELVKDPVSKKYPKACYCLDKSQRKVVCDWVKELKFPDGYVSKLSRCVDDKKFKMFGMKSHDCHVFMQRLLPIAFRELLPRHVWECVTELSRFFCSLSSNVLKVSDMMKLEEAIPVILCKMEMIFPPALFNSMEHLPIHLPYEARLAGPVHFRWMYPFERFMGHLKKKVKNKAHVEGSICNAYLVEEAANFCSFYFDSNVHTRARKLPRNNDVSGEQPAVGGLELFSRVGRPYGQLRKERWLDHLEYKAIHTYLLLNCPELDDYVEQYRHILRCSNPRSNDNAIELLVNKGFAEYFEGLRTTLENHFLRSLSVGPGQRVKSYSMYFINGYKFHTSTHGSARSHENSYVGVVGEGYEYYGQLQEILEIDYSGTPCLKAVVFKCKWYDPTIGVGTNIHPLYKIVEVKTSRQFNRYEPFIVASQAIQVYLARYPGSRGARADWAAVCRVKARGVYELPGSRVRTNITDRAFQEDEVPLPTIVVTNANDNSINLADPENVMLELNDVASEDDYDIEVQSDDSDDLPEEDPLDSDDSD